MSERRDDIVERLEEYERKGMLGAAGSDALAEIRRLRSERRAVADTEDVGEEGDIRAIVHELDLHEADLQADRVFGRVGDDQAADPERRARRILARLRRTPETEALREAAHRARPLLTAMEGTLLGTPREDDPTAYAFDICEGDAATIRRLIALATQDSP